MNNNEVIERISFFRTQKNMSARDLSLSIGKSQNYINRLEYLKFNVNVDVLFDILEVLGVSVADFFGFGEAYSEDGKQMLEMYNKLSNSNKETVKDLIKKLQ